jgi:hypothetical protein
LRVGSGTPFMFVNSSVESLITILHLLHLVDLPSTLRLHHDTVHLFPHLLVDFMILLLTSFALIIRLITAVTLFFMQLFFQI